MQNMIPGTDTAGWKPAKTLGDDTRAELVHQIIEMWSFIGMTIPPEKSVREVIDKVLDADPPVVAPFPVSNAGRVNIAARFDDILAAAKAVNPGVVPP